MIIFNEKKIERFGSCLTYLIDFESQNFAILTTFTQLTARLKNFLMDWLLVLGQDEVLLCRMCDTVHQKLGHTKDPTRTYLLALADTHSLI